jgi:hypothetical protein
VLETVNIRSFIEVAVEPLANALTVRVPVTEMTDVQLTPLQGKFTKTFHDAILPVAHVALEELLLTVLISGLIPCFLPMTIGLAFLDLADIDGSVREH